MSDSRESRHLPPEIFIDVLESAPVDASWKYHLASCEPCRTELDELRSTLAWARSDDVEALPVAPAVTVAEISPASRAGAKLWIASAAAVVLAALFLYGGSSLDSPAPVATSESQEILPPIEQDEEFQWLLVFTDSLELDPTVDSDSPLSELVPDPEELTLEQREELLDRLAEEMRARS